jgi:ABC-2 type transport system ATP-binding protein
MEDPEHNIDLESRIIIRSAIHQLQAEGKAVLLTTSFIEDALSISDNVFRLDQNGLKKVELLKDSLLSDSDRQTAFEGQSSPTEQTEQTEHQTSVQQEDPPAKQNTGIHEADPQPQSYKKIEQTTEREDGRQQVDSQQTKPKQTEKTEQTEDQEVPLNLQRTLRLEKIPAKVEDKILLFDPLEINYVESMEGTSYLFVQEEKFPCDLPMHELEKRLRVFGFFRCHRSYIVNLQRVREVIKWTRNSYSLILDDPKKSTIPLSKGKMEELKQLIGL